MIPMPILFMSIAIPKFADENRIKLDINAENTSDPPILSKISRANDDASMEMAAIILNNFDVTSPPPDGLVQITTAYATAIFWIKYRGSAESNTQANKVMGKANRTMKTRDQPIMTRGN